MLKKIALAFLAGGIMMTASACNTVKGMGRDISSIGQAGSDAMH